MGVYDPERDYTLQPEPPRDPLDDEREVDEMWARYQRRGVDLDQPYLLKENVEEQT